MRRVCPFLPLPLLALAASCTSRTEPQPAPPPPPPVTRPPPPAPPPVADWPDRPLTPGAWYYSREASGSQALFGPANSEAAFILRCDPARRQVTLSREGVGTGRQIVVRTSSGARALPATTRTEPLAYTSATVPASDPFLDAMLFSRGRIAVEVAGLPILILPTWAEPARAVEDCRS